MRATRRHRPTGCRAGVFRAYSDLCIVVAAAITPAAEFPSFSLAGAHEPNQEATTSAKGNSSVSASVAANSCSVPREIRQELEKLGVDVSPWPARNDPARAEQLVVALQAMIDVDDNLHLHRLVQNVARDARPEVAGRLLERYRERRFAEPRSAVAAFLYGRALALQRDRAAEEHLRASIELDPGFVWGYIGLAYYYTAVVPDHDRLSQFASRAVAADPECLPAYAFLTHVHDVRGQKTAASKLRQLLDRVPPAEAAAYLPTLWSIEMQHTDAQGRSNTIDRVALDAARLRKIVPRDPVIDLALIDADELLSRPKTALRQKRRFVARYADHPVTRSISFELWNLAHAAPPASAPARRIAAHYRAKVSDLMGVRRSDPRVEKLSFECVRVVKEALDPGPRFSEMKRIWGQLGLADDGREAWLADLLQHQETVRTRQAAWKKKDMAWPRQQLEDLAGRRWSMSACQGQPLVVVFWASWCAPCVAEFGAIHRLQSASRRHRSFKVVTVTLDEDLEDARKAVSRHGLTAPVIAGAALHEFIPGLPVIWIVDTSGRAVLERIGGCGAGREVEREFVREVEELVRVVR